MANTIIPFPHTSASPAHAGHSLLHLEGEIRNIIYAELFEFSKPILFHYKDDDAFISLDENGDDVLDHSKLALPASLQVFRSAEASSMIKGGLGLLRSCRQIYYEAASVLYSNNVFRFTKHEVEHVQHFGQLPLAVSFCRTLGFSLQFLRKVDIDVSHICPSGWCSTTGHRGPSRVVEFAPLAKLLWTPATANCHIRFIKSENSAIGPPTYLQSVNNKSEFDTEVLNNLLVCLRNDSADLKKFARQIQWIRLSSRAPLFELDGARGWIKLQYRRSEPAPHYTMILWSENNGQGLRWDTTYRPSLFGIPSKVRHEIYKEVLCPPDGIIIDMDTGKRVGCEPGFGLLSLMPRPSEEYPYSPPRQVFWEQNKFVIRMSSSEAVLPLDKFASLQNLLCKDKIDRNWRYPWANRHGYADCGPMRLELKFKLDGGLTLSDVRIGVMSLIRLTSSYNSRRFDIDFVLTRSYDSGATIEKKTVSLHSVQSRVLELLSRAVGSNSKRLHCTQFEVYVDGYGEAKSVELTINNMKHVFEDVSFTKEDTIAQVVSRYGVPLEPGPETVKSTRYDGTLWCWFRFLEEIIAKEPNTSEHLKSIWNCHVRYFGIPEFMDHNRRIKNYLTREEETAAWARLNSE